MKMMRWFPILLLVFIFFFGCTENKKSTTVSYIDIEGYWVSGFLLHNTELSRGIAEGKEKKPKVQLLRLKNSVNGFADTSYRIHGDTLFYRIGIKRLFKLEKFVEEEEIYSLRIVFYSKDRMILMDDITHEETTFYNLSILPAQPDAYTEIILEENGRLAINDSTKFNGRKGCTDKVYLLLNMITNRAWKNDLDSLVTRINWKGAIFTTETNKQQTKVVSKDSIHSGTEIIFSPLPPSFKLQVKTQKHLGSWRFSSSTVSDPALSAIIAELKAFEMYCYVHDILRITM